MMRVLLPFVVCALAAPVLAQDADEQAVRSEVEGFLLRLGDAQYSTLDADFAPKALVVVTRQRPATGSDAGQWANNYQTAEEWLAALKRNPTPTKFREPIDHVTITVDSHQLAYVRGDFQVLRDGKAVSSGVDQFTLVRDGDRWKIVTIAYTSIPIR
jgi:ketosteroid isomerase-like protein